MDEPKALLELDLSIASREVIEILLDDMPDISMYEEIARANKNRPEILQILNDHPETPEDIRQYIAKLLQMPAKTSRDIVRNHQPEMKSQNIYMKIQKLSVMERMQLALKGGRDIRTILVKDSNKQVMLNVLENQKITETEIEEISRSRSINEEALRTISKNRDWMKRYNILYSLATNPKTPVAISMPLINSLKQRDLVLLEKNKNVPEAVRITAKKIILERRPK